MFLRQYGSAIEDYNEAIRLNSADAEVYSYRGIAKFSLGQYESAIRDSDEAIRLNPDLIPAYINRGHAKAKLRYIKEARVDFEVALELSEKQGKEALGAISIKALQELDNPK